MSACSYVQRRGSKYYVRVRIPVDIAAVVGQTHIVSALATADAGTAKILVARLFFEIVGFFATMRLRMACALDTEETDHDRLEGLAVQAFVLGQEYEARKENLKAEFSVRLRQLIAGLRHDPGGDVVRCGRDCFNEAARLAAVDERSGVLPAPFIMQPPPASASPSWTSLRKAFLEDKPVLTTKTLWSYNQAFDTWAGVIGAKPIGDIRRADVKAFADYLRDKPNLRGGSLNHKSIERSLGHIKIFMSWAVAAGHVADDHFGDVRGRDKIRAEIMAPDARRAFTAAELQKLFFSPLFRKPKDEAGQAAAWFLAIAALTGARTEEIAMAPAELVRLGETWWLDLRQVGTKTQAAPRLVPLLPDLIRLGLPEWAARQSAAGRRLVQPGPETRNAAAWSKYLNRYLNMHVTDAPDLVLYSLRHSFRHMLRAANIGDELANKIFGHESGTVGAGYGKDLSPQEAELVVRSVRPPVELKNLRAWF